MHLPTGIDTAFLGEHTCTTALSHSLPWC